LNQNKDADKLIIGVARFIVGGLFVIKLGVLFVIDKNGGGIKEGCSSGHKLNITGGFADGFQSVNNSISKNNTS
jgi:hypothetical protein